MMTWISKPESLNSYQGLSTSDHTPAVFNILHEDKKGKITSFRVLSINKLNPCHSKEECRIQPGYSNNPMNLSESREEYLHRCQFQYDLTLNSIQEGIKENRPLHAIFMQEPYDLVFLRTAVCVANFTADLEYMGWKVVVTNKENHVKPMAILYDAKRLTFTHKTRGLLPSKGKNTLFEALFEDQESENQLLALVNCHLNYSDKFQKALMRYQYEQIGKKIFTIIAGDTNNTPENLISFAGSTEFATNIGLDSLGHQTIKHGNTQYLKRYCNVGASPALKGRISIIEEKCGFFVEEEGGDEVFPFKIEFADLTQKVDAVWKSKRSMPWIREDYLILKHFISLNSNWIRYLEEKIKEKFDLGSSYTIEISKIDGFYRFDFETEEICNRLANFLEPQCFILEKSYRLKIPRKHLDKLFDCLDICYLASMELDREKAEKNPFWA